MSSSRFSSRFASTRSGASATIAAMSGSFVPPILRIAGASASGSVQNLVIPTRRFTPASCATLSVTLGTSETMRSGRSAVVIVWPRESSALAIGVLSGGAVGRVGPGASRRPARPSIPAPMRLGPGRRPPARGPGLPMQPRRDPARIDTQDRRARGDRAVGYPPAVKWQDCSDAELMQAVGRREVKAVEALYDRYARLVFSTAYRVLGGRARRRGRRPGRLRAALAHPRALRRGAGPVPGLDAQRHAQSRHR